MKVLDKKFKIYKGYNFRVLEVPGFDKITFGCPPGIVKDFARRNEELTSKYILPTRTLVKGKNNFDFEFIVYSFLFMRGKKEKINVYCTQEQKRRFHAILSETLFGPTFLQLLQAQCYKWSRQAGFNTVESRRFEKLLEKVASDRELRGQHQEMLKRFVSDRELLRTVEAYCGKVLSKNTSLTKKLKGDPVRTLARHYLWCAQLQREMDLFAMTPNGNRRGFLDSMVDFHIFDKGKGVTISSRDNPNHQLEIIQVQPSYFEIYESGALKVQMNFQELDPPHKPEHIEVLEKPMLGATFLGVGSGFAPDRRNSCVVVWSEGKGIMVDAFNDNNESLLEHGITENDIEYMFLSHVHSDHDSGFIEKVLSGQRIKVMTTRIIFESFLRKIEAITLFPREVIESFIDYFELEPGKKIRIPGFKRTFIEFDYSLHSIPAGRFRLTCRDAKGRDRVISHSGDTKYDRALLECWFKDGYFSPKRYKDILGFIWDADMVIHEVGGGLLHTEFSALSDIKSKVAKRMVLTHQHKKPVHHPDFHFAMEGETLTLLKASRKKHGHLEVIKGINLFHKLPESRLKTMLKNSRIVRYKPGDNIFKKGELGDTFYVVLEGFAEIILDDKKIGAVYEKGMFFGELAITTDNPLRRATVKALSDLTLLEIPKAFYLQSGLPSIMDDFYRLDNHFNRVVRPGLVASLGFGSLTHWKKGQAILFKGNQKDAAYLIVSGTVKMSCGEGKKIAFLTSGDIMGEISNWKAIARRAVLHAHSEEVFAVRLEPDQVTQLFRLYPSFHGTVYQKIKKLEARLKSG